MKETEQLKQWRQSSPENEAEYLLIVAGWGHSFNNKRKYESSKEEAFGNLLKTLEERRVKRFIPVWMARSAAAVFIFFCAVFAYQLLTVDKKDDNVVISSGDNTRTISLEDGTKVWLNKNSGLTFSKHFEKDTRNVILTGEGYFEVAKDPSKPFIIQAGNSKTTVLGTAFNINMKNKREVEISVVEGKVQFSDMLDTDFKVLTQGEKAVMESDTRKITKQPLKGSNTLSWKTGILRFDQTALKEVIADLEKFYETDIELATELENIPITFTLTNTPLDQVMELLKNLETMKIEKKDNTYYLTP